MTTQQNGHGVDAGASYTSGDTSVTVGVGGDTSGEAGATPGHETMAETGGSGGDALTQPRREETAPLAGSTGAAAGTGPAAAPEAAPEGAGLDATAIGRTYQDTRAEQAGQNPTGLGTPETGANQNEGDLAPPHR
jgi:hypothetical protein